MEQNSAIDAFTALAQETRLAVFRQLVREGPGGLAVGELSRRLGVVPSTLSGHLGILKRAGLLTATRHQREIHYAANLEAMGNLIRYMLQDCCDGKVENCNEIENLIPQPQAARG